MKFPALDIDEVIKIRGYQLRRLRNDVGEIPPGPGVYIWRYWPSFSIDSTEDFKSTLKNWANSYPHQTEVLKNQRSKVSVTRSAFGFTEDDSLLGLNLSQSKTTSFLGALESDKSNIKQLKDTFSLLMLFSQPLYVGKADSLQTRLSDHFNRKNSTLLAELEAANIDETHIYISYISDEVSNDGGVITTGIEEILQRLAPPFFTKRIG